MPRAAKKEPRSRGQVIARGENKWLVRVYIGQDSAGKRKYSSKTVEGTYTQADRALTKMLGTVDEGTFVAPSKLSVAEYLTGFKPADTLPDDVAEWKGWVRGLRDLGPKTRRSYAERITKDILPFLGSTRMDAIADAKLEAWVTWMEEDRKLSPRTIQYSHTVLKAALEDAVEKGQLVRNAARYVKTPKVVRKQMVVLTPKQVSLFLEKTIDSDRHALWFTLLTTGLRPQEALALQWDDIKYDEGEARLSITKAMVETEPGRYTVGPTKTERWRNIEIPQETLQVLEGYRARQAKEILKQGSTYHRQGFIFAGRSGHPLDPSAIRLRWKAELKQCGLPVTALYGARHTHITMLLGLGVHPKVASERAGHSSTKLTLDTYSHVSQTMQREATNAIGSKLFKRAVGK